MSEDDFIFMEKCLLRSLVVSAKRKWKIPGIILAKQTDRKYQELEKLISFSGTPTVVWRRTGEICLVGAEFCLLTEWKKEDLINGRKYIYEVCFLHSLQLI